MGFNTTVIVLNDALGDGWGMFKRMLEAKCQRAGVLFGVVNEAWSTQTCNACGVIAGPKGRAGLNKRVWACACGAVHDRDVNAALNIRARGLAGLEAGAAPSRCGEVKGDNEVKNLSRHQTGAIRMTKDNAIQQHEAYIAESESRVAFEKAAQEKYGHTYFDLDEDSQYIVKHLRALWEGWELAREFSKGSK